MKSLLLLVSAASLVLGASPIAVAGDWLRLQSQASEVYYSRPDLGQSWKFSDTIGTVSLELGQFGTGSSTISIASNYRTNGDFVLGANLIVWANAIDQNAISQSEFLLGFEIAQPVAFRTSIEGHRLQGEMQNLDFLYKIASADEVVSSVASPNSWSSFGNFGSFRDDGYLNPGSYYVLFRASAESSAMAGTPPYENAGDFSLQLYLEPIPEPASIFQAMCFLSLALITGALRCNPSSLHRLG